MLLIIALGYAIFACYCSVQSLQVAIKLQDPRNQPSVETMDRLLRNLDVLADIALVNLPTREVLRRHRAALEAPPPSTTEDAAKFLNSVNSNQSSKHKMNKVDSSETKNTRGEMDSRTSKEVRNRLEEEAFKASIPTKEMEVIEWEQALFRAAKRALARSKTQTPKVQKMIKTLLRSAKLHTGDVADCKCDSI